MSSQNQDSQRSATSSEDLTLPRFSGYIGNRSSVFRKEVFLPFVNHTDREMKRFKGAWNGQGGYTFKTRESRDQAKLVLDALNARWAQILSENPEGAVDIVTRITADYFKHNKKSGNPNSL